MSVKERAPAKVNLGLRITGKRADGYHNILSIFQTVELYDELHMTVSPESGLSCDHPDVPQNAENLILKAEDILRTRHDITSRVHFRLTKRIPVGGGLGGGSSDAAAAIRGLKTLYGLDISDIVLMKYGEELGFDVPFLLRGGTAVVSGRGERVEFVSWPFDFTYVIVYPNFGISTAWAYSNLDWPTDDPDAYQSMTVKLKAGTLDSGKFFDVLRNDFEGVVFQKYPVLKEIKALLTHHGARTAILTGSGSSMLGIFEEEKDAQLCTQSLKSSFSSVFIVKAHT
ncbi:4-(cytidine 5'-diphospho)-2-C-methyl-D-erythritol kinase [Candidatus Latescibacterota bacterium]